MDYSVPTCTTRHQLQSAKKEVTSALDSGAILLLRTYIHTYYYNINNEFDDFFFVLWRRRQQQHTSVCIAYFEQPRTQYQKIVLACMTWADAQLLVVVTKGCKKVLFSSAAATAAAAAALASALSLSSHTF